MNLFSFIATLSELYEIIAIEIEQILKRLGFMNIFINVLLLCILNITYIMCFMAGGERSTSAGEADIFYISLVARFPGRVSGNCSVDTSLLLCYQHPATDCPTHSAVHVSCAAELKENS